MGSLSPIFSTEIRGILERTSVYCNSSRNSASRLSADGIQQYQLLINL
jgi:hypothetical protein